MASTTTTTLSHAAPPLHLVYSHAEWSTLLMASAYEVLDARDSVKQKKLQRLHLLITSEFEVPVERAQEARVEFDARVSRLMEWAASFMPSEAAARCLEAARTASQHEWSAAQPTDRCAFTRALAARAPTVQRVTFYCNRAGKRVSSTHCLDERSSWRAWIEAAMVVGSARKWTDERVAQWIDAEGVKQINEAHMNAMHESHALARKRQALEYASSLFVRMLVDHAQ